MRNFILCLFVFSTTFSFGQTDSTKAIAEVKENLEVEEVEGNLNEVAVQEVQYKGDLSDFINKNMNSDIKLYLKKNNIKGVVMCVAEINKIGEISYIRVHRGLDPYIDNEIIRVLKLTKWKPAYTHNKPIARRIVIPFTI